jgi:hypothetical protein
MNLAYQYPVIYWNTACLSVNAGAVNEEDYEDLVDEGIIEIEEDDENKRETNKVQYGKVAAAIGKFKTELGLRIELPDVNRAKFGFTPDSEANVVWFGLKGISRIGDDLIRAIIDNRPYVSVDNFVEKLNKTGARMLVSKDRVIALRSFVGLLAELTAFQGMGFGIRMLYSMIADATLGDDDDEEEKNKSFLGFKVTKETYNATKYPVKAIFNDLISPIPLADGLTTAGLNYLLGQLEYLNEKEIKDAVNEKNRILEIKGKDPMSKDQEKEFIENLKEAAKYQVFSEGADKAGNWGMLNIAYDTYKETYDMIKLSNTGEFMDDYQGRETSKKLLPAQKESLYYDSKIMIAFSLGILPKDVATVVKKRVSKIKKKAVTEKQYERFDEVQKELNRDLKNWEIDIVKDKKEVGTAIDELNFIERNGGLTESQGLEYVKLMKLIGAPTVRDLDKIKKGMKTNQILK